MQKNDEIILDITDVTAEGNGVGKYDSLAVFVPQSAVGDKLKVRILKVKKNYCFGKIIEVLEPSESRCEIDCDVFSKCGGCVYRHIDYTFEAYLKQKRVEETMKRIGGIDIASKDILTGRCDRYRNKAQFPVNENGQVGFFAVHSHRIIPCGDCLLQPDEFYTISNIFEKYIKTYSVSCYNEETGRGLVRHLYLRKATATEEIMVCVVINGKNLPNGKALVDALVTAFPQKIKTVVLNVNTEKTNVILGKENIVLYGEGYITDILCSNKIRINPLSFYQVNREMAERLYHKAQEYACPENKTVLDLYCGAGTIGLSFAKKAKEIIGVEIIEQAVQDAKYNAQINGIKNARFICADATKASMQFKEQGLKADVVVLDPPRKGCSGEVLDMVSNSFCPQRIVYVSCDCATLARDCKILEEKGYKVIEYTPVDLFPRTAHVEVCCLLSRTKAI
ncbi:MAG: 23S rRNA (uracil(1939)-C(5))-methyltransferase RlmD [Acutalibacteraceae bacterium]|nr:23S rRNA (uracil(1939)-C(5))-methyltransferase RlmD [Acutalibacteraceae bacterium]